MRSVAQLCLTLQPHRLYIANQAPLSIEIVGKLQEGWVGGDLSAKIQELYFLTGVPVAVFSENLLHLPSQQG